MAPLRTLQRPVVIFLVLGMAAEILIVAASTVLLDLSGGREEHAQALMDDGTLLTVAVRRGFGGARHTSTRERGAAWSPQRALGPPDTPVAGDFHTAWASATADGGHEWIELEFARPVAAVEVRAYESFKPGAISSVSIFDQAGRELTAQPVSDRAPGPGVIVAKFVVPAGGSLLTSRAKLY